MGVHEGHGDPLRAYYGWKVEYDAYDPANPGAGRAPARDAPSTKGQVQHKEFVESWGPEYADLLKPMRKIVRATVKPAAKPIDLV